MDKFLEIESFNYLDVFVVEFNEVFVVIDVLF